MTRQEAIRKCDSALFTTNSKAEDIVAALEALGLLKFDKEESDPDMIKAINLVRRNYSDVDFAYGLAKEGYKIVKSS